MKVSVLIVEDDQDLGNLLKQYLELNQFRADRVFNGEEARAALKQGQYDILVLDVMMPKEDGFTLAKQIRQQYPEQAFLFVTARKQKDDILNGLKLGADDYITKPFDADELILRITNILRRAKPAIAKDIYEIGIYRFDPKNLLLVSPTEEKILTEKEAALLLYLNARRNELVPRKEILTTLWGEPDFFNGRSMDVFVSRLRKYLVEDGTIQIDSIRGVGFRMIIK